MRLEKPHLDCASSAPSQHGSTPVALLHRPRHREDYLQGPAGISPRRGSAGGPGGGARGPAAALLAGGPSLPAQRVLAHGGVHAPDVGAARHGGLSHCLTRDSASFGVRRVLLSPAPAAGVVVGSRARRPRPGPNTSRTVTFVWSVARHSHVRARPGPPGRARRLRSRRDSFHVRTNIRTSSRYHGRSGCRDA
jgi:hypothetical protein